MLKVSIESPYRAKTLEEILRHVVYAKECFQHSLSLGEAPYASHLFLTTLLRDELPSERELGFLISDSWRQAANVIAVYTDLGISPGMEHAINLWEKNQPSAQRLVYRSIRQGDLSLA